MDLLGDQFGFRRGKGSRDAIEMLRIISEGTLEIDEELCVCFRDWQKEFDRVNWTKLTFRHRASSILGQAFRYSPENAFYIFNQQIYFII